MKKTTLLLLCCWLLAVSRVAAQSAPPSDSVRVTDGRFDYKL